MATTEFTATADRLQTKDAAAMSAAALELGPDTAAALLRQLRGAKVILRSIVLAEKALQDGSISWKAGEDGPERWSPLYGEVCSLLCGVREIVVNTVHFSHLDWFTPLCLAEALDAALWQAVGATSEDDDQLNSDEISSGSLELIRLLDEALGVCIADGLPQRAALHQPIAETH